MCQSCLRTILDYLPHELQYSTIVFPFMQKKDFSLKKVECNFILPNTEFHKCGWMCSYIDLVCEGITIYL